MSAETFLELAKEMPWAALAGYLVWRLTHQESRILEAFREGAESHKQLAQALQTLQRLETFHISTAEKLTELQVLLRELQKEMKK